MSTYEAMTFTVYVDWDYSGSGTPDFTTAIDNISSYVKDITTNIGVQDPLEHMAYVGTCTLLLNNTSQRFSPFYANSPLYGKLKPGRPVRIDISDGVTTWVLFRGKTVSLSVQAGALGPREASLECQDALGHMQNEYINLQTLTNIRSDTLIRHVINAALKAAVATATVTLDAVPNANDTLVLGDGTSTYTAKWVAAPAAANDVDIGADIYECGDNLSQWINKGTGEGTAYYSSTLPRFVTSVATLGTANAASNYDSDVALEAAAMTGEVITTSTATTISPTIGDVAGTEYSSAETFLTTEAGKLSTIGLYIDSKVGSPSPLTIELRKTNATGALVYTSTWTPTITVAAWYYHTLAVPIYLEDATTYFVSFAAWSSPNNAYWLSKAANASVYADGDAYVSTDGGAYVLWDPVGEMDVKITTTAITEKDKLAQGFQVPIAQSISTLQLDLCKFGLPTGTDTLRVETDSGGDASGSLVSPDSTTTLAESSLTTTYGLTTFTFANAFGLAQDTQYHLVLSTSRAASATEFVLWAADASAPGYTGGSAKYWDGAAWQALNMDFIFSIGGAVLTLSATLRGTVGNAYTLASTGAWATLSGANFAGGTDLPSDLAPSLATGKDTFPYACDTWRDIDAMSALREIVESEHGSYFWISRSGTITFKNRLYWFEQANATIDYTMNGQFNEMVSADTADELYNRVEVTYTPAGVLATGVVAASKGNEIVPGMSGLTERWNLTQPLRDQAQSKVVKLPATDPTTGQAMGIYSIVTPLVATTDWECDDGAEVSYTGSALVKLCVAMVGNGVEVSITNSCTGPLRFTKLQVRGVGLTRYQSNLGLAEDATSQDAYGRKLLSLTLPIATTVTDWGQTLATWLLSRYKDPAYRLNSITFMNQNLLNSAHLMAIEIGDTLSITDSHTGLSAAKYMITGLAYSGLGPGRTGSITFYLHDLGSDTYAVWDTAKWDGTAKWSL